MKKVFLSLFVCLLVVSCTKPFNKGQSLAKEYNDCIAEYEEAIQQVGNDFIEGLPGKYKTRAQALQDYKAQLHKCYSDYQNKWVELEAKEKKIRKGYKDEEELDKFESGLDERDYTEFVSEPIWDTIQIPSSVMQGLRSINPVKPNTEQITHDLIGHTLSEGKEKGYYSQSWHWVIEKDEISNVEIVSEQENTDNRYTILVSMRLNTATRAYDAKAVVSYRLEGIKDWEIDFVHSEGMSIVQTHQYDDCVKCYRDSWDNLYAENDCDIALEVAGRELGISGEWKTFRTIVSPHQREHIAYYISDFEVDYIERP